MKLHLVFFFFGRVKLQLVIEPCKLLSNIHTLSLHTEKCCVEEKQRVNSNVLSSNYKSLSRKKKCFVPKYKHIHKLLGAFVIFSPKHITY
jgi:hypothetical protein